MAKLDLPGQVTGRRRLGLLPAEATSFVGRAAELASITALLTSARLVTVTGTAGVGKTRACLRACALSADRFADGVWLAELSELRDPALLFSAVAGALGLPEQDARSQRAAVLDHLRDRRLVLMLDTCEHLVDACAEFAETVLRVAPRVTLLATSRQPLDAPGEHACRVPPLPISGDAVELFAQRAAAVMPGFEVTPGNRADVVRLCRRLDGIPLAIELAAVRLRALPLPDLADRLEAGFGVLAASRRGTTERHQTLRAAVEWSYHLCTPAERSLWARLSVFTGPFDATAAEEVCADAAHPREEIIDALIGLVDKSVVLLSGPSSGPGSGSGSGPGSGSGSGPGSGSGSGPGSGAGSGPGSGSGSGPGSGSGENRYRLLDAQREFGSEKLAADDDQARVLDRFCGRYLSMATGFDRRVLDDGQVARYRELRLEHANITAALEHTLGDARATGPAGDPLGHARQGAALAVGLHAYWQMSGQLSEGRNWLGKVLRLFAPRSPEHARALGVNGRLATLQGDIADALAEIRESIRLAGELGESRAEARGYLFLNLALIFAGSRAEALAAGETARQTMTACEDRVGLVCLEAQLGYLHQLTGNADLAMECCERGLAMLGPSSGERLITGYLHLVAGFALFQRPGRAEECAAATRRAVAAKHEIGDVAGLACALEMLGWLAVRGERFDDAAWLFGAADPLWRRTPSGRAIPGIEVTHRHMISRARRALGDKRYEAAHAHGAGMPLDDVVERTSDPSWSPLSGGDAGAGAVDGAGRVRLTGGMAVASAILTRREREIADLVASGLSNREIATRLFISKRTVDAHVEHIFGKLEISSRVQLTVWLQSAGRALGGLS